VTSLLSSIRAEALFRLWLRLINFYTATDAVLRNASTRVHYTYLVKGLSRDTLHLVLILELSFLNFNVFVQVVVAISLGDVGLGNWRHGD